MTTLHEVWRLALPPQTQVCAGVAGGQPVRAVAMLRSTQPALPTLQGGELILLSPALLEALDPSLTLDRFLRRLQGTAIAAVAVGGPIDEAAAGAANATQMVLFCLPASEDLRTIRREVERLLADPEAQHERRAAQLYAALTRDAFGLGGRAALVKVLHEWTGQQVTLPAQQAARTIVPVVLDGRRVTALGSDGAHQWDHTALEQGASALALLIDKERAIQATEERLRGDVVDMLLTGLPLDAHGLRRAGEQGIAVDLAYVLLVLMPNETHRIDRIRAAARRALDRLHLHGVISERDELLLIALRLDERKEAALLSGETQVRGLHQALADSGLAISGGFGLAPQLADWPNAWTDSVAALKLGRDMLGAGVLAGGAELGVYRLMLSLSDMPEARLFYERTIEALAAHDQSYQSELLHTLESFFAHLGNHSQAAAALHIHRNTLLYRLGKISAITGHRLDRSMDRLALQVGLALYRIYRVKRVDQWLVRESGPERP